MKLRLAVVLLFAAGCTSTEPPVPDVATRPAKPVEAEPELAVQPAAATPVDGPDSVTFAERWDVPPPRPSEPAPRSDQRRCGLESCGPDQFCEERRKGHALDEQGRPIQRKKCVPLPDDCKDAPNCECVRETISFRGCVVRDGLVHTNDYPKRRGGRR